MKLGVLYVVCLLLPVSFLSGCGGQKGTNVTSTPTSTASQLTLSITSLDFGQQLEGTSSIAQYVLLSSSGTAPLVIQGSSVGGTNPGDFIVSDQSGTCTTGMTLAPGAKCNLRIVFDPAATGSRSATLLVTDNTAESPHSVALSGTGGTSTLATAPQLTLSAPSLDFGQQSVGTPSSAQYVLVSSTGTAPLVIQGSSVGGTNPGDFSVSNQSGTCTTGMTLAPGATCNLQIVFDPAATGSRSATLLIADNTAESPHSVALSGTTETLGQKLRRLENAAATNNPLVNQPLTLPTAWTPNTSYCIGQMVSNGGNLYRAHSNGGCNGLGSTTTSASGGGPTGSGAGPISDGSVTWYYDGPAVLASSVAPGVTNTTTAPAALTNRYTIPADASNFLFTGGAPYLKYPIEYCFAAVTVGSGGQCSSTQDNNFASITFITGAPQVAIGQYAGLPSRLIVDGQYFSLGGLYATVAGNPSYYVLDFTGAGGSETRTITLENEFGAAFWGVLVDPANQVSAPDSGDHLRVIAVGDSITNGGNGFPDLTATDWPSLVAKTLGWNDVWNSGLGGTGYISQGPGNAYPNFGQRLEDVCANSPDLVIVFGGINDGNSTLAQVQAAALAYFQAVRACLPSTPLIVLGAWPGSTGPAAQRTNLENSIHAAVTQLNDPITYFVPIVTDPNGSWITGTGNVSNPVGNGNADLYISSDGVHPTSAGIAYLAGRITTAVKSIIQQIP